MQCLARVWLGAADSRAGGPNFVRVVMGPSALADRRRIAVEPACGYRHRAERAAKAAALLAAESAEVGAELDASEMLCHGWKDSDGQLHRFLSPQRHTRTKFSLRPP
jgi:hypothetical protein